MTKAEYTKQWRAKNKARFLATEKAFYTNNKQHILHTKSIYENNRRATDLNYKLRKNLRSRLNKALKQSKTASAIVDLGCTVEEFKLHLESKFYRNMTWETYGQGEGKWQIDHIKPLCSFDLTDPLQSQAACHYTNLQPLWNDDHRVKSMKDLTAFARHSVSFAHG